MTSSFAPFFIIFFIFFLAILPACSADPDTFSGITFLGGKYLSDDFPGRMYPGQSGQYMVEFYNTGMTAWENDVEKIGVECFTDSSIISVEQNIQLLPKGSRVHSGKSYHFPFSITALNTGRADLVFAVVQLHPSGKTMAISDKVTITIQVTSGTQGTDKKTGSIQVSAGPLHLPVKLDGKPAGLTPLTIPEVSAGVHTIIIEGKEDVMEETVVVDPGSLSSITYSPERSVIVIETRESLLLDDSNPILKLILSNFFVLLGLLFAFTTAAVISVVIISGKMKKIKFTVSQVLPCSIKNSCDPDFAIETRRKLQPDEVLFEPVAGLFSQGEKKSLKVQVTNLGKKAIVVQNVRINPGNCKIILREIMDDDPGDNETDHEIAYTDGDGREKSKVIRLQYRIKPRAADISWLFKRFIFKNGKTIAIVKLKNNSPLPVNSDSITISPGEEKEVELELEEPVNDASSVYKKLQIFAGSLDPFPLSVKIPYNMGIFLYFSKEYTRSLEWFNQQLNSGIADPTIKKYLKLIEKKLNLSSGSHKSASLIQGGDFAVTDEKGYLVADVKDQISSSPTVPGFPDSLLDLYRPSALIASDRLGLMFWAARVADNEEIALRIIDSGILPPSQVELQIHAWRALKHANILQIKFWERDPIYFIELELPSGAIQSKRTVFSLADLKVPIPPRAALRITRGLAEGIDYIHRQGVRHYLLEPSVIFLDQGLNPKISGFDASALPHSKLPPDCWVTAPEQRNPEKYGNPGKKTDIYQAGAIFNYLLSGQVPDCTGENNIMPSHFRPSYAIYDIIIQKTLHVDKNERYGEITEMIQDLEMIISSLTKDVKYVR